MSQVEAPHLTPAARRVLAVAGELFYRQGINTVGMELIAATAGVTKKTVYDRFGSKEALVMAYLRDRDLRWRRFVTAHLDGARSPREKVLTSFDALADWMADNHRGCAMINAFAQLPDRGHEGRQVAMEQKSWLLDLYTRLLTEAGFDEPESMADLMLILHEGATVSHYVAGRLDAVMIAKHTAEAHGFRTRTRSAGTATVTTVAGVGGHPITARRPVCFALRTAG